MQIFIDLDLRRAVQGPGDRTPISPIQCSSQDTLEMDVYYVRNANVINPGAGIALKFGLFDPNRNVVALQSGWNQLQDTTYNQPYWEGLIVLNTTQMATAVANVTTSINFNGELRYQLADGEIIHTIYLPFTIFPALLQETGTPPVTVQNTYPDSSTLLVTSMKGAAGGVAELDGNKLMNPAEEPIDNRTIVISNGKMAVPIDGLTLVIQNGKLVVPIDGQTIVLKNGVLQTGFILTTFSAAWTTVGAGATTPSIQVADATKLVNGQAVRIPVAGYYTVTIVDPTHVTLTNNRDPFNAGAGVTIASGSVILPAQLAAAGSGSGGSISLAIGTVNTLVAGSVATASITGTAPNYTLNLGIPAGAPGGTPANPTLAIGSVSTLAAGATATATITGTYPNFLLNLGIPQGASGGGTGGGGGLSSLTDAETTTGQSMIYDGSTGKLKRFAFDPLFNVTDQGTYWQINFPSHPRTDAILTVPGVGSNTPSLAIENQASQYLQPGLQVYISGAGLYKVISTATSAGVDSAVFQNLGSQQGYTNAAAGATIPAGAWIAIIPNTILNLTDAETSEGFSLIASPNGVLKRLLIPSWLLPDDSSGTEIKINAGAPQGAGDMTRATYDQLTASGVTTPAGQVDQSRIIVMPSLANLRNFIDNSSFAVAQRGPSFTGIGAGTAFQLDRWQTFIVGTPVFSLAQTNNPSGLGFVSGDQKNYTNPWQTFSAKFTVTTPSSGANDIAYFRHSIEAPDHHHLGSLIVAGQTWLWTFWTVRFLVKSSVTGTFPVGLWLPSAVGGTQYNSHYTIATANAWNEVVFTAPTVNVNVVTPGVAGLSLIFFLAAGSTAGVTAGTFLNKWGTNGAGNAFPEVGDGNFAATNGATIEFANISLCLGRQPIIRAPHRAHEELDRCQRFLNKSYDLATAPGALTRNGSIFFSPLGGANVIGWCPFPVRMAKVPTAVTIYDPTSGGSGQARNQDNSLATGVTAQGIGERGFSYLASSNNNFVGGVPAYFHYMAGCEI